MYIVNCDHFLSFDHDSLIPLPPEIYGLSLNLEVTDTARLTGPGAWEPACFLTHCRDVRNRWRRVPLCPALYVGPGDVNSGLPAWAAPSVPAN